MVFRPRNVFESFAKGALESTSSSKKISTVAEISARISQSSINYVQSEGEGQMEKYLAICSYVLTESQIFS